MSKDIHTDKELLINWMRARHVVTVGGELRWYAVKRTFNVGAKSARQVCERFGFDPNDMVAVKP